MFKDIIKGIFKDKFALIAFFTLVFIYLCLFFADIIAPYTKDYTDRQLSYVPPSPVFTIDENGKFHNENLKIEGRHDVCLCPRIVPVIEAMTAVTLCDLFLQNQAGRI